MKHVQFTFAPPDYGWIDLQVSGCADDIAIYCSVVADPFPDLFAWLEQIAAGTNGAVWHVEEEGPSARLIFLAGSRLLGDEQSYLLFCRSSGELLGEFAVIQIEREELVRRIYSAFRAVVEDANYYPRHWDIHPRWHEVDQHNERPSTRQQQTGRSATTA